MLVNPLISVPCKHCQQTTTINVKSISSLNTENERLQRELDEANKKIKLLELAAGWGKSDSGGFDGMFGDLFSTKKRNEY